MTTKAKIISLRSVMIEHLELRKKALAGATSEFERVRDAARCFDEIEQCCRMGTFGCNDYFERFLVRDYRCSPDAHGRSIPQLDSVRGLIVRDLVVPQFGITRSEDRTTDYFYKAVLDMHPGADIAFGSLDDALYEPCVTCKKPSLVTVICSDEDDRGYGTWLERLCLHCPLVTVIAKSGGRGRDGNLITRGNPAPFAKK